MQSQSPGLREGRYFVEVHVWVWPYSQEEATKAGKTVGRTPIWTTSLWAKPIRIQIHSDIPTQACP